MKEKLIIINDLCISKDMRNQFEAAYEYYK